MSPYDQDVPGSFTWYDESTPCLHLHGQDQAGIFINSSGQPTGTALTFPTTPGAIVAAGAHVLAACTDGMHVYDRAAAAHVQSLPWLEGSQPSPGQRLLTGHDPKGACICLAGMRKVSAHIYTQAVCPEHMPCRSCTSQVAVQ